MREKVFYSAGYLMGDKSQTYEIPFCDFIKSVYNTPGDRIQFGFRTYNNEYQYRFNKESKIRELTDYLNSTTSHNLRENASYGIDANKKPKKYFLSVVKGNENPVLDLRYTRAYMEHKYLLDNKLVSTDEINIKDAEALYKDATKIHLLSIKLNISKNYKIIDKIADLFDKIQEEEIQIISCIIDVAGDK